MATFDVCIVGAGPHALAVLSALHTPNAKLSEDKHMRRARGQGARGKPLSSTTKTTVCVVDPSGEWLHQWNERFAALGIQYLRSPSWAHPDMFSSESLAEFAWREGRTDELRNVDSSLGALSGMPDLDAGYFRLPGTQLFHDFCAEMIETLPHTFVKGKAVDVITAGDTHEILVQTPQAPLAKIRAKQVVLALGAAGAPNVPRAFEGLTVQTDGEGLPRLMHTSDWRSMASLPQRRNQSVLVIGGGLSAAQAALKAVRCGARHTVLCSRRPLVTRHYDIPLEFMDRREGKGKWRDWFFLSGAKRAEYIKSVRGGGSIPPDYMEDLYAAEKAQRLALQVKSVARATSSEQGIHVEFDDGSTFEASCVILGTGSTLNGLEVPLIASLAARYDLPARDRLPVLDDDLQWRQGISVVGALAAGQLGPDAGNLTGARKSAIICADNCGVFDNFCDTKSAVLANSFGALANASDDDCSDYQSD